MFVAAERRINRFGRLVGGAERRQRIQLDADADRREFLAREQRRGTEFGDVGEHRHLQRVDELRSEEHTSELQSLMRNSYAVFCLKTKKNIKHHTTPQPHYMIHYSHHSTILYKTRTENYHERKLTVSTN